MFLFEVKRYFNKNYKRCIIILFFVLLVSLYSLVNVPSIFFANTSELNLHNYIIGELNSAQFVMFFAFPLLFSILVSDLILSDFNSGYINLILPRAKSRLNYITCKFFMILFIAILFTTLILVSKYIIAIIIGMPFKGNLSIYVFMMLDKHSMFEVYLYAIIYLISGLTLIGMLTLFISINIKNSGIPVGIIILIGFLHNIFYIMWSKYITILPFAQYIIGLHNEFGEFGFDSPYFTLKFSFIYMWISILILFLLIFNKIRKYEIRRVV